MREPSTRTTDCFPKVCDRKPRASGPYGAATRPAEQEARAGLVAFGVEMGVLAGRFAAATGLHATDVRAIWVLAEPDTPRTAGELGARLGLSSAAATRRVDRLERPGDRELPEGRPGPSGGLLVAGPRGDALGRTRDRTATIGRY